MTLDPEDTREVAAVQILAADAGLLLELVDVEAWQFRLSKPAEGGPAWVINLWPWMEGGRHKERIQHDPELPGPRLVLPRYWTVRDAVDAAILAESGESPEGRAPVGGRFKGRW